tara:strand:- start:319 stop:831 length:513 start_codon:yes stop_codon:yes gene_type:complete
MKKNKSKNDNPLNIKQSTYVLIPQIKELAKTMSQKEVEEKLRINKKTLKKIKDAENIKFRKSYLPIGATKKSIPYADRYTDDEKSEMYRKRKENEANDDRITKRERIINKRERDKKYYKELKKDKKRLENKRQRDRKSAISRWNNLSQEDWEIKKQRDREYQAKRTKDLN